jgi:lipid-A-disaccharide synthase
MEEMRRLRPELRFQAFGGASLRRAGAEILVDTSGWAAMGIAESVRRLPKAWFSLQRIKVLLRQGEPGLFIAVDFGAGNFRIAPLAKAAGWRIAWHMPPGSWRRDRQGADLPGLCGLITTPFPWSAELLQKVGADARFYGHPLTWGQPELTPQAERSGIAWLPGSRPHETDYLLPEMARAAAQLPGPHRVSVARADRRPRMEKIWRDHGGPEAEWVEGAWRSLGESRAAVVCSGTATLQAALARCPMAVVYRGPKIMELEYIIRKPKFDFMAMPNIILGRAAFPEFIQHAASAEEMARQMTALMPDGEPRLAQLEAMDHVAQELAGEAPVRRAAEAMVEYMDRSLNLLKQP